MMVFLTKIYVLEAADYRCRLYLMMHIRDMLSFLI